MKLIKVKTKQLYKLIDISPNLPLIKEKSRKVPVYICELTEKEYLKLTKIELEALEKLDNTLCLNNNRGNLEFGIDAEEHCDCNDVTEMVDCLEVIEKALQDLKLKTDKYDKINKVFNDSHICEIKKELAKYEPLCEETKCDECALGIGDGICLKATFETKWKIQKEKQELEKYKKAWEIAIKKEINFRSFSKEIKELGEKFIYEFYVLEYTNYHYFAKEEKKLTEEEFELLKEILQWID